MASYEALEPGGHAHLVGKIKDYANRASGTDTTQIADGSVTSEKLSDGVQDTLAEIAVSVDPMLKNGLRGTLSEGMLLTTDDAYAAPAHEVDVFGKSTQAGTPTPSSPVPILSVDALTLHASADGTTDYTNWPVSISLSDHVARSLPDGTRDELTLSYIGPSTEHEGWGVFSANLTKVLDTLELDDYSWIYSSNYDYFSATLGDSFAILENGNSDPLCDVYASYGVSTINNIRNNLPDMSLAIRALYRQIFIRDSGADGDVTTFTSRISGGKLLHKLTTPQTHDLGTVELPILPNPLTAWADGGSAQPTMSMVYERDVNIARANIISALAEIATS